MSEVGVPNWTVGEFRELAWIKNGYAFKSSEFLDEGYAAIVRMSNLKLGRLNLADAKYLSKEQAEFLEDFRLYPGDFVFGMSGSLDSYAWVRSHDSPCFLNQRVGCLKPRVNVDPTFVSYLYTSEIVKQEIAALAAGAAQLNISRNQVESIQVPIPPLPEQQKIAAILSSVDEVIEKTRAQMDKLKDLKTGMMQELLTQGIGHTEFKDSPVGRIPSSWTIETLIGLSTNGISNGVFNDPAKVGSGYRLINVYDMYQGFGIKTNSLGLLQLDEKEFFRNKVEVGDVFFTRSSLKLAGIAHCNINLSSDPTLPI